jgi:hypothetical protein
MVSRYSSTIYGKEVVFKVKNQNLTSSSMLGPKTKKVLKDLVFKMGHKNKSVLIYYGGAPPYYIPKLLGFSFPPFPKEVQSLLPN